MTPTAAYGLALSIALAFTGIGLLSWQWAESRRRPRDLSAEDETHFARQDVRRWVVAGLILLLSAGTFLGSRMAPRLDGQPNLVFLQTWLWVVLLVLILLTLALFDWFATRRYARRHRHALLREGLEILRSGRRLAGTTPPHGSQRDGSEGPDPVN